MTTDQLDEIEKLAEVKHRAGLLSRTDQLLLVIKALREAREDAAKKNDEAWSWMWVSMDLRAERDEARAEVQRLRGIIARAGSLCSGGFENCYCYACSFIRRESDAVEASLKEGE